MVESKYIENPVEEKLIVFPDNLVKIGPQHHLWEKRVLLEIKNLRIIVDEMKSSPNGFWFNLFPSKDRAKKYKIWKGVLMIPGRPDIKFDLRVLLSSEYPYVYPRAFVEESLVKYAGGNMYLENKIQDDGKTFVMICHDHVKEKDAWYPNLSIAHFLIREIWYWWCAKIDQVIKLWDEDH